MAYTNRAFCFMAILTVVGNVPDTPDVANAQTPSYVAVTTDSVRTLAEKLKQDLQNGSILFADVHAMELKLALRGKLREDISAHVSALEQLGDSDKPEPQLTAGLVPVADKLIQALDEPNLDAANKYSEELAVKVSAQQEVYLQKELESVKTGKSEEDRYFKLSGQLHESLLKGDVARAAIFAVEVQSEQDAMVAKKKIPVIMIGRNDYDINDALGRAALLRKDYLAAGDYLLKAADTPAPSPAMRTFGPDLWLARALLKAGYKDVVRLFLERCKVFWSPERVDEWISTLQSGGSPDFGQNIFSQDPILSH